jgi:hypothetical protein
VVNENQSSTFIVMLRLDINSKGKLLAQPESGMGYQIVEAITYDKKVKHGIVSNAELLLFENEPRLSLTTTACARLLNEAKSSIAEIYDFHVLPRTTSAAPAFALKETAIGYGKIARPAKDAPIETTKEKEVFKRFLAYEEDNRITPDGSLLPGAHATTEEDAKNVRTGKEAVARYALPNPKPASNVFTIRPHKVTLIQYGIVEPAYGQPGSGVEVIFTKGTDPGTAEAKLKKIPEE